MPGTHERHQMSLDADRYKRFPIMLYVRGAEALEFPIFIRVRLCRAVETIEQRQKLAIFACDPIVQGIED